MKNSVLNLIFKWLYNDFMMAMNKVMSYVEWCY